VGDRDRAQLVARVHGGLGLPFLSYQLSAISYQLSAISYQLKQR
jgi:hypothetical protein